MKQITTKINQKDLDKLYEIKRSNQINSIPDTIAFVLSNNNNNNNNNFYQNQQSNINNNKINNKNSN